ncbi:MAG: DMT family transporter [Planctomycetota bacterium]|nr:DMT family transporter [Planctomycetota bacterium]
MPAPDASEATSPVPQPPPGTTLAIIAIVGTLAGWTSIPLFLHHFAKLIDPWTANGWRYAISALIWLPVLIIGASRKNLPPGLWKAALWPSLFNSAAQVLFGLAPYYVEPGLMVFSLRVQIVFVAIGAAIFFVAERRVITRPLFLTGLIAVIVGTLSTVALREGGLGEGRLLGIVMAMGSGMLYAGYALAVRKSMTRMNPISAFAAVSQYTAILLVIPMFLFGKDSGLTALHLPTAQIGLLVLSAIIGIGLGHTFYFYSMSRLGVTVASGVVQLQPVTVSIASAFVFGERMSTAQWATGFVAICGAALMLVAQHRARREGFSGSGR